MIEQGNKTLLSLSGRRIEISTAPKKNQSNSKANSLLSRSKGEVHITRKISTGSTANSLSGNNTSRIRQGQETSGGVQKLVNQVSNGMETKRQDKTKNLVDRPQDHVSLDGFDSKSFLESSNIRDGNKKMNEIENEKFYINNLRLIQSIPKELERCSQSRKSIVGKKDQTDKIPTAKSSAELKNIKSENSHISIHKQVSFNKKAKESTKKVVEPKKRKPSGIPIRKNRRDGSRKPKFVSTLLKKPLKDTESSFSFDISVDNNFTPIDEISLSSELQMAIQALSSSEKLDDSETLISSKNPETGDVELEKCLKNSNISIAPGDTSIELLEEKLLNGKKAKLLDLEKVKTSSITVLESSPFALNRLESLHKQNILTKKKMNEINMMNMKTKLLTSKSFSNSMKKSSKKLSCISGIRNKSNVRLSVKSSKNNIEKSSKSTEKFINSKISSSNFKELSSTEKEEMQLDTWALDCSIDHVPYQVLNSKQKYFEEEEEDCEFPLVNSVGSLDKSFSQKETNIKVREEREIQTSRTESKACKNFEKSITLSNAAVNISKVEIIGPLTKTTVTPVTPPLISDQDHIKSKNHSWKQMEKEENSRENTAVKENTTTLNNPKCNKDLKKIKPMETETAKGRSERRTKKESEVAKADDFLIVRGTALIFNNAGTLQENDSKKKVKTELKIDLNLSETAEMNYKNLHSHSWFSESVTKKPSEEQMVKNEKVESSSSASRISLLLEWVKRSEKSEPSKNLTEANVSVEETSKTDSFMQEKFLNEISNLNIKGIRKKIRSDAGDRPPPSLNPFFASNTPFSNKAKVDTKLRNSLTKSYNKEEQRETFEEVPVKLKRRSSEPISVKGYIWKQANFSAFRGHKPSVSSIASSLRHLNADDFDDFICWEPLPQKVSFCWEKSLYQFKKPWSVLCCSVFRDNKLSSAPGQILENLKNGGNYNPRQLLGERKNCGKENLFDVEPSIAQKNIDIRNWLEALNFPTSSNSFKSEVIIEGNFANHSAVDSQSLNKTQVTPKRRKVIRNSKFQDKSLNSNLKDSSNQYFERDVKYEENFRNVFRRRSDFVVDEELDLKNLTAIKNHNVCVVSKSAEENSPLQETDERNTASDSKVIRKLQFVSQSETSDVGTIVDDTLCHSEHTDKQSSSQVLEKSEKNLKPISSVFNTWKCLSLFILFTAIIIIIYYYGGTILCYCNLIEFSSEN